MDVVHKEDQNSGKPLLARSYKLLSDRPSTGNRSINYFWVLACAVEAVVIAIIGIFLVAFTMYHDRHGDLACARHLSPYSPYLESRDLRMIEFMESKADMDNSPYKGSPTAEMEMLWTKLYDYPTIRIPEDRFRLLGKDPSDSKYVRVAPEYGPGFLGEINVFHQLHCLNTIRQVLHRDDYDYSSVGMLNATDPKLKDHLDHCIEALRRYVVCSADVSPFPFTRASDGSGRGDFEIPRKCRDYSRIQAWAVRNQAFPTFRTWWQTHGEGKETHG